jgi:hypothetical protein
LSEGLLAAADSTWVDAVGVEHTRAGADARIVSLVPSITELLFALGLGPQIVGRTSFCVHPRETVAELPKVGGTKKVRLDRLCALKPTHVILNIDENTREIAEEIAPFVPYLVVTHPLEPRDNLNLYQLLGGIFDRSAEAAKLCTAFAAELARLEGAATALPRRKVLYLIWRDPWMTVSRDTYISRTLALVNWQTQGHLAECRYPEMDPRDAGLEGVDLVLLSSEPYPFRDKHLAEFERAFNPRQAKLALIDGEMISWYGSRAIGGLRYLHDFAENVR